MVSQFRNTFDPLSCVYFRSEIDFSYWGGQFFYSWKKWSQNCFTTVTVFCYFSSSFLHPEINDARHYSRYLVSSCWAPLVIFWLVGSAVSKIRFNLWSLLTPYWIFLELGLTVSNNFKHKIVKFLIYIARGQVFSRFFSYF